MKRFKDVLKENMKKFNTDIKCWESRAMDMNVCKSIVKDGTRIFESKRSAELE